MDKSTITYTTERIATVWDEALEGLALVHADEVGLLGAGRVAPNRRAYEALEAQGGLRVYAMRAGVQSAGLGALVGYCLVMVFEHPHFKAVLWGQQDVLFVHPDYRGRGAVMFLRWMDEQLKGEGVAMVLRHVTDRRDYSRTLTRMGYATWERSYIKEL